MHVGEERRAAQRRQREERLGHREADARLRVLEPRARGGHGAGDEGVGRRPLGEKLPRAEEAALPALPRLRLARREDARLDCGESGEVRGLRLRRQRAEPPTEARGRPLPVERLLVREGREEFVSAA